MATAQAIMPTAAYVGFAGTAAARDAPAGQPPDIAALLNLLKSDPDLPRADRLLSLSAGAMAYFEFPDRMLSFAHLLAASAARTRDGPMALRAGIHVAAMSRGTVEISLSTRTLDTATQIASHAAPGQVLASREFHTVVTRILKLDEGHFKAAGEVSPPAGPAFSLFEVLPTGANVSPATAITPEFRSLAEHALADAIGPLARLLARRAVDVSFDRLELAQNLARSIPEGPRRDAFVAHLARYRT